MARQISVVENILSANDQVAASNRSCLDEAGIFSVNLMASPGAGKTSLLVQTLMHLKHELTIAVVDGDLASSIDAERAEQAGAISVQINTGGGCHLDAMMLHSALKQLPVADIDLLIVENVGNLVCPANFQLGTHQNILIASIPEGDDKPYKYPSMYQHVDVLVINKIDLLPYIDFDLGYFKRGVSMLNPDVTIFEVSCTTGEGIEKWCDWVTDNRKTHVHGAE